MKVTLCPPDLAHPYFLYFFSRVGVPLSLLIHLGGVDSSPRGNLQRRRVYGGGLMSVSKSIRFRPVRGFLQDRFWALVLLGFLWGSGGFHNQGLHIRRIREFVNKRF